jgi:hypothetical protein
LKASALLSNTAVASWRSVTGMDVALLRRPCNEGVGGVRGDDGSSAGEGWYPGRHVAAVPLTVVVSQTQHRKQSKLVQQSVRPLF